MCFTVLISIYKNENAEYFHEAMKSIWDNQTLKPDEIVLVKDGPLSEDLEEMIEYWSKKLGNVLNRVPLKENIGLGAALNEGLKHCSHELVARMDTDDISMPERFEKQVNFMRANPDIAVSSCWIEEFNDVKGAFAIRKLPFSHSDLKKFAKLRSPISHAASIFRKSAILSVGGYPSLRLEDYALWSLLIIKGAKFANLKDILYEVRADEDFMDRRGLGFLKAEINLFLYQVDIGLIGWFGFFRNCLTRSVVRLSPSFIKQFLYKYARG